MSLSGIRESIFVLSFLIHQLLTRDSTYIFMFTIMSIENTQAAQQKRWKQRQQNSHHWSICI